MGREQLLEAMEREAQTALEELRHRMAAEEDELRRAADDRLTELQGAAEGELSARVSRERERPLTAATASARRVRLEAQVRLSERLRHLARGLLPELSDWACPAGLEQCARELPSCQWEEVTVAPRDAETARRLFPGSRVLLEPSCAGGFMVSTRGGRIRVDNRLEKRLERLWDDLLPGLWRELLPEEKGAAPW
jgi:vacuolar-type H+-ATPase subunit E/Vma4